MSAADAGTPRVFLYRHGETEWARIGRYTGISEIPLNEHGIAQVSATGKMVVGAGLLIDPSKIKHVFSSPRKRAMQTYELAFGEDVRQRMEADGVFSVTEKLAEWGYGDYEGLHTHEIRELRKSRGLDGDREWDIWRDGCEGKGGESAQQLTDRLDSLIHEIRALQKPHMRSSPGAEARDVVLFAHGHLLRAFVKRWLAYPMDFGLSMMLEPGGVGVLSYQHRNIEEPAVLVGIGFPVQKVKA